jgi:two-component system chemotaxis sensor kinase CheA
VNGIGWSGDLPEAARRRVYAQLADAGAPPVGVSGELAEAVARVTAGLEARHLTARALCTPEGTADGTTHGAFADEAEALVAARDGVGLYRASQQQLQGLAPGHVHASALRWLLTVLAVASPDRALVLALVRSLRGVPYVAPPDEAPRPGPSLQDATALLTGQLAMLAVPCEPELIAGRLMAVSTVLGRVLAAIGLQAKMAPAEAALAEALARSSPQPLQRMLTEVLQGWQVEVPAPPSAPRAPPPEPAPEPARVEEAARHAAKVLKVEPARIEALLDLVGELVVAKNSLPFLARRAEDEFGSSALGRAILEQYGVVNRITEALQGAVMRVRMVPLSEVFRRFPRLVRDLSGKLDKRIRLDLVGEDTEADKDVVQDLFDPLMHLMRNSIDHGLEGPEERERAGKPPEGTIRLSATQHEDQVVIELGDDGRGIDPEALTRKAVEKGFLTPEAAAKLSDDEALQLIFLAGFSTAQQVTSLSGRGVGMDVVRSMVARVGGTITLQSQLGLGTTTTISLPLTMAVSHVMVVEAGGTTFGVPFSAIVETVRLPATGLKAIQGGEAMVLRDRLVPVCRLARVLGLEEAGRDDGSQAMLLARAGGEVVAFAIDEFHEAVDVIVKPLTGVLKDLDRYAGTALLGDGRPLLVLDLEEVVRQLV